jgi:hypothetical protein
MDSGNHRTSRKRRFSSACISKDGDIFHSGRSRNPREGRSARYHYSRCFQRVLRSVGQSAVSALYQPQALQRFPVSRHLISGHSPVSVGESQECQEMRRSAMALAIRSDILPSKMPTKAASNPVQLMLFLALHATYLTQAIGGPRFHDPSAAIGRPAETAHRFAIS